MERRGNLSTEVASWLAVAAFSLWGAAHIGWGAVDYWLSPTAIEASTLSVAERAGDVPSTADVAPVEQTAPASIEPEFDDLERLRFASPPDLTTALAQLEWKGGDAVEVARLMSVIRALELGWHRQGNGWKAKDEILRIVGGLWPEHAQLVAATTTPYGGTLGDVLRPLMVSSPADADWNEGLAGSHPRFLELFGSEGLVKAERLLTLAKIHAELSSAGDYKSSRFIANMLIEAKSYDELLAWVSKGLNGGLALDDVSDFSELPENIILAAWERGVSIGSESRRLTEHLLLQGHRPALRWLIWRLDGAAKYISSGDYTFRTYQNEYMMMFRLNVTFRSYQGRSLGQFYSRNWRDIHWNAERKTWQLTEVAQSGS
jgi:hypothetical protein